MPLTTRKSPRPTTKRSGCGAATSGGSNPAAAAASWIAKAEMSAAQERLDRAKAAELLSREAMERARQATEDAIRTATEPQRARQCRARAAALETAYDTYDLPIIETAMLRHEKAERPAGSRGR